MRSPRNSSTSPRRNSSLSPERTGRAGILASMSRISSDGKQYAKNGKPVPPTHWGMSIKQLTAFYNWIKRGIRPGMTVRELVEEIIRPNSHDGLSVALRQNQDAPKLIRYLVSHAWEEDADDFFNDLVSMAKAEDISEDDGIFICFLSVFQGSDDEIALQVSQGSSDISDGCFAQILDCIQKSQGAVWVIPNDNLMKNGKGLFSRLWCGWEAFKATDENVKIKIHPQRSSAQHLFGSVCVDEYTLESGSCGDPKKELDIHRHSEQQIRQAVKQEGGWEKVNTKLIILTIAAQRASPDYVAFFLKSRNPAICEAAVNSLGCSGATAAEHAEDLAELLGTKDYDSGIGSVLAKMGKHGAVAAAKKLFSKESHVREAAAEALENILKVEMSPEKSLTSSFGGPTLSEKAKKEHGGEPPLFSRNPATQQRPSSPAAQQRLGSPATQQQPSEPSEPRSPVSLASFGSAAAQRAQHQPTSSEPISLASPAAHQPPSSGPAANPTLNQQLPSNEDTSVSCCVGQDGAGMALAEVNLQVGDYGSAANEGIGSRMHEHWQSHAVAARNVAFHWFETIEGSHVRPRPLAPPCSRGEERLLPDAKALAAAVQMPSVDKAHVYADSIHDKAVHDALLAGTRGPNSSFQNRHHFHDGRTGLHSEVLPHSCVESKGASCLLAEADNGIGVSASECFAKALSYLDNLWKHQENEMRRLVQENSYLHREYSKEHPTCNDANIKAAEFVDNLTRDDEGKATLGKCEQKRASAQEIQDPILGSLIEASFLANSSVRVGRTSEGGDFQKLDREEDAFTPLTPAPSDGTPKFESAAPARLSRSLSPLTDASTPTESKAERPRLSLLSLDAADPRRSDSKDSLTTQVTSTWASRLSSRFGQEMAEEHWFKKSIQSPAFDSVCAVVIICNAIVFGVNGQIDMEWALDHVGSNIAASSEMVSVLANLNYGFFAFYTVELLIKLYVFRCSFFTNGMRKWNIFDLVLVLSAIPEFFLNDLGSDAGDGLPLLRLLRLLKLVKMLRVVRVLRFFRVLRMMLASITSSLMTLCWSIILLWLIMYVFSLCFMMPISSYLLETPTGEVSQETLDAVEAYWKTVPQATITLYLAVTGGSDWEPLAMPLRECGEVYFLLFCLYIAFTVCAVLNILTGMYVECANEVAKADDEAVGAELLYRNETNLFREHFSVDEHGCENEDSLVRWEDLEANIDGPIILGFLDALAIGKEDFRSVFKLLDTDKTGSVELEEFIKCCISSKMGTQGIQLEALVDESRRSTHQQCHLMQYIQERFDSFAHTAQGIKVAPVKTLEQRLRDSKVLPVHWALENEFERLR